MNPVFANAAGLIGVACILITYFLTQSGRIRPEQFIFSLLNLVGSSLILFSLLFDWNLSAALVEGAWALISLFGLVRYTMRRRQRGAALPGGQGAV